MPLADDALRLLRHLTGIPDAEFRPGQLEAIRSIVDDRGRTLVIQRTGWGKSAVYLIATRLLRGAGAGPTVIVSPLLALMRNQLEMTERLDLNARRVDSTNRDDWEAIFEQIRLGLLDLLLISPERLNNREFIEQVSGELFGSIGLLVIDEVHCISDWGHDFRPDYRRLRDVANALPPRTPVLGTTATANDRVVEDVNAELGGDLTVLRGTLERESLALHVVPLPDRADRMAWLATTIPDLPGSGIVYCLTVRDAQIVGGWLQARGVKAATYTGETDNADRLHIEDQLSAGRLKVVVATSALAMGYDNPFIEFVVHYQAPGSAVAYYQQVGRAGRAVEQAVGVLLAGQEDTDIQDWFIETAFPSEPDVSTVLDSLRDTPGQNLRDLEGLVNLRRSRLEGMLKILEVDGAVYREQSRWFRSASRWAYPSERFAAVTRARRAEQQAMQGYVATDGCLMEFLRNQLDDPGAQRCGRCANCMGTPWPPATPSPVVEEALRHLRGEHDTIQPRKQLPCPLEVEVDLRSGGLEVGRCLTRWGDPGLAQLVRSGKYVDGRFADELVEATRAMLRQWAPEPDPTWVTWVPSLSSNLVGDFARRLGNGLGLDAVPAISRVAETQPQKAMQNSCQQARNVAASFAVDGVRPGPVFLVDDMVDSRWTFTILGSLLRSAGAGPVYPVALSNTSSRSE